MGHATAGYPRRQVLAVLGLGGAAALGASGAARSAPSLDLKDPVKALEAYIKLRGSTAEETTYCQYDGDIFLSRAAEDNIPLVGFRGITKSHWKPDGAGGFVNRDYDVGIFVDHKTGEPLKTWRNPLSGEMVEVAPYISGPSGAHHRPGAGVNDPYGGVGGRWGVVGDSVWISNATVLSWPNSLSPTLHPKAWSGPRLMTSMTTTYTGRVSDVLDPAQKKVRAGLVWNDLLSPSPWMRMGQRPVMCDWRMIGAKAMSAGELTPSVVAEVDAVFDGFIARDAVWTTESGGWTQYRDKYPNGEQP